MFENFEYVKNKIGVIPNFLYPFFKTSEKSSIFFRFFELTVKPENPDIDNFIGKISNNKEHFYSEIMSLIFINEGEAENSPVDIMVSIENSDIAEKDKLPFAFLCGNFDDAVCAMCEIVRKVYSAILELHNKKLSDIVEQFTEFSSKENILYLKNNLFLEKNQIEKIKMGVSLINPYVVFLKRDYQLDIPIVIYGIRFQSYEKNKYANESVVDFIDVCGSRMRIKMLQALTEYDEMTLSDFSRYLGLPTTTVIHNLRLMEEGGILTVSRRETKLIYYKANSKYLSYVKEGIVNLLDKLIN